MKKELKKEHIIRYKESGMSRAEYCRANGLNYSTFQSWLRQSESSQESGFRAVECDVGLPDKADLERNYFCFRFYGNGTFEIILRFGNDLS